MSNSDPGSRFMAYAKDFELTFDDDNWSRLEGYFAPDAVYEVRNVGPGWRLVGPAAILAGMKRSLDGFDRRLPKRVLGLAGPPAVDATGLAFDWTATYAPAGAPRLVLRGHSSIRYRDGLIVELVDSYADGIGEEVAAWNDANDLGLELSYT
jgi:hypothetical protein